MAAPSFRLQIAAALAGLLLISALLVRAAGIAPAATAPAPGGTFVEGIVGTPRAINPLLAGSQAERDLASLIFAGLTRLDAKGEVAPDLAATWQVSPDGLHYTFFLRPDARWSDSPQEPVTADDVLFTVGLLQDPRFPGDPALTGLWRSVHVTRLDRRSVRFDLTQPYSPFLQYTTLGLLPAHLLRDLAPARIAEAPFNAAPVGAGRWCIVPCGAARATPGAAPPEIDPAQGLVLAPNPNAGDPPLLQRLWLRFYPTPGALLTAFDQGEIDGVSAVEPAAVAGLPDHPDLRVYNADLPATELILLNLRLPLFDRRETRQALLQSLDRAALVRNALAGQGQVADSPLLPSSWAYHPLPGLYPYDPTSAAALLDAAGWASDGQGGRVRNNTPLHFTLAYAADNPVNAAVAASVQADWRRVGVAVTLLAVDRDSLLRDVLVPRQFEAVLLGWQGVANDPDVYQLWHSTQARAPGFNFAGWRNDRADQDLEQARQTLKRAERAALYADFQQVFAAEVPGLLLYYPRYTYAVRARVQGITLPRALADPSSRFQSLPAWYIQTAPQVGGK